MTHIRSNTIPGLPAALPSGEHVLWQGSPDWRAFAVRVFHTRFVAGYFGVLIAWSVFATLWEGGTMAAATTGAAWLTVGGALALGVLGGLAWLFSRTTVYTLTNRRIAMRFGVALPMTINIPLACVDTAGLRVYPNGTGDIPFQLKGPDRFAYFHLWPNARPWRYSKAEPMIRAVPDVRAVAEAVARALLAVHEADAARAGAQSADQQTKPLRTGAKAAKAGRARRSAARPLAAAE